MDVSHISVEQYVSAVEGTSYPASHKPGWEDVVTSGLIGEFGSVATAFKKHLLHQKELQLTPFSIQVIGEELGDFLWYLVALARLHGIDFGDKVMMGGLAKLPDRFTAGHQEETHIRLENLEDAAKKRFLEALEENKSNISKCFDTYQHVAAITQLSDDTVQMTKVCLSEVSRFVSRLTRNTLSRGTQDELYNFGPVDTLSCLQDIMWSISNIAEIQGLSLAEIVTRNQDKTRGIYPNPKTPTPLRTAAQEFLPTECFPKKFEIQILDMGENQSRMYWNGRPLGDDINDNSHLLDGYRFHDVLHLTFIAYLGWSPVVRKMMKCKRKSVPEVDVNEDGARAAIVEELVINFMHTEAIRLQKARQHSAEVPPLFPEDEHFSSNFGSALRHLVRNLEVADCKHWEWEKAAHRGFAIYEQLQQCKEGTLTIDREKRSIEFTSDLALDLHGVVIRQGVDNREMKEGESEAALITAAFNAISPQLEIEDVTGDMKFHSLGNGQYIGQLSGRIRESARQQKILSVKLSQSESNQAIVTFATALGDPADFVPQV